MEIENKAQKLGERKVVRRGLLMGTVALGAGALAKLVSPQRAQASDGQGLVIGNTNVIGVGEQNATAATVLNTSTGGGAGFVISGGSGATAASTAIHAVTQHVAGYGVVGRNDQNAAYGVAGVNFGSGAGVGVEGQALGGTVLGVRGVHGNGGTGVKGVSNASGSLVADGTGGGIGVHGKSGNGPGVQGNSVSSLGVRGISNNFVGVVGISDTSHGLYGSTSNAGAAGLVGENLSGGVAGFFYGSVQVYGGLQVFGGPKNAVLKMQDGTFASVYCQESPEPYFEDFGRAQLVGGVANVALEREFATLVAGGDYMVFPVAEGETRGLFVSRRTPGGFEVREMQGGTGNVPFTYRIVTRRKDIEGKRFARVNTDAAQTVAGARAALAAMGTAGPSSGPASGPSSGPSSPPPTQQPVPPTPNSTPPSTPFVPSGPGSTGMPPGAGPSSGGAHP